MSVIRVLLLLLLLVASSRCVCEIFKRNERKRGMTVRVIIATILARYEIKVRVRACTLSMHPQY